MAQQTLNIDHRGYVFINMYYNVVLEMVNFKNFNRYIKLELKFKEIKKCLVYFYVYFRYK